MGLRDALSAPRHRRQSEWMATAVVEADKREDHCASAAHQLAKCTRAVGTVLANVFSALLLITGGL